MILLFSIFFAKFINSTNEIFKTIIYITLRYANCIDYQKSYIHFNKINEDW